MIQNGKQTTKRNRYNWSKLKRTRGLTVSDLKTDHLDKQTKKSFDFKHDDSNTIKNLFATKTTEKESEAEQDNDNETEKQTKRPKQAKRKRKK